MKKRLFSGVISVIILVIIASSCKTSNDVVSDNLIQKRKYRKGFYVNKKSKVKKNDLVFTGQEDLSADGVFVENNSKSEASLELENDKIEELIKKGESYEVNSERKGNELASSSSSSSKKANKKAAKLDKKIQRYKKNLRSFENGDDPPMKKLEVAGLVGLIALILSVVMVVIESPLIAVLLMVLALILSIVSFKRFRENSDKLYGKAFPIITISLFGLIVIGLMIAIVVAFSGYG